MQKPSSKKDAIILGSNLKGQLTKIFKLQKNLTMNQIKEAEMGETVNNMFKVMQEV